MLQKGKNIKTPCIKRWYIGLFKYYSNTFDAAQGNEWSVCNGHSNSSTQNCPTFGTQNIAHFTHFIYKKNILAMDFSWFIVSCLFRQSPWHALSLEMRKYWPEKPWLLKKFRWPWEYLLALDQMLAREWKVNDVGAFHRAANPKKLLQALHLICLREIISCIQCLSNLFIIALTFMGVSEAFSLLFFTLFYPKPERTHRVFLYNKAWNGGRAFGQYNNNNNEIIIKTSRPLHLVWSRGTRLDRTTTTVS